jgi:hypothetical protein
MSVIVLVRQWVLILAQMVGIGGVLYETIWEHADRPVLLKLFGLMIGVSVLGNGSWLSLLQGLHINLEVKSRLFPIRFDLDNRSPSSSKPPTETHQPESPSDDW